MSYTNYICKNCGPIENDQVYIPPKHRHTGATLNRRCLKCSRETGRNYTKKCRELLLANTTEEERKIIRAENARKIREDRAKFPEKYLSKERRYKNKNPMYERTKDLRVYGISATQYEEMLKSQNNRCAICYKEETAKSSTSNKIRNLSVDHCHKKLKVRGLLCSNCNQGLGFFKEDPKVLAAASDYLRCHNGDET